MAGQKEDTGAGSRGYAVPESKLPGAKDTLTALGVGRRGYVKA